MQRTIFTIDGVVPAYIGYTDGDTWNGWATPYFEKDQAMRLMEDYNKNTESPMFYNEEFDTFYHFGTDGYSGEMWKGEKHQTAEGIKTLYGIGAYCWIWDAVNTKDLRYIAQEIEEFIFYHETYKYMDEDDLKRDGAVDTIIEQFKSLEVLYEAINVMRNEELKADERFEKLGGILKL
jgi:hypothetical protein